MHNPGQPRQMPSDAMIRRSLGFAKAWLKRYGLESTDVHIFETEENDASVDVVCLDDRQFSLIPPEERPRNIPDTTGQVHLLFLPVPSDG